MRKHKKMVASPCLYEESAQPAKAKGSRVFELGTPGSLAGPVHKGLEPARIGAPNVAAGTAWTEAQAETWDMFVAAMWRGML